MKQSEKATYMLKKIDELRFGNELIQDAKRLAYRGLLTTLIDVIKELEVNNGSQDI
jgi:hypothetical protein